MITFTKFLENSEDGSLEEEVTDFVEYVFSNMPYNLKDDANLIRARVGHFFEQKIKTPMDRILDNLYDLHLVSKQNLKLKSEEFPAGTNFIADLKPNALRLKSNDKTFEMMFLNRESLSRKIDRYFELPEDSPLHIFDKSLCDSLKDTKYYRNTKARIEKFFWQLKEYLSSMRRSTFAHAFIASDLSTVSKRFCNFVDEKMRNFDKNDTNAYKFMHTSLFMFMVEYIIQELEAEIL